MAAREAYALVSIERAGIEYIAGLELRPSDNFAELSDKLERAVAWPLMGAKESDEWDRLAYSVEKQLKYWWPDRAYLLEVGKEDKWVQLFQPYGLPRATERLWPEWGV
jgi:hypothetical protein